MNIIHIHLSQLHEKIITSSANNNGGSTNTYNNHYILVYCDSKSKHTSVANNKRLFSPPDKPLIRPGSPIRVFSTLFKFNYSKYMFSKSSSTRKYLHTYKI